MRRGIVLQIKGLGIPVQAPTDRNQEGYEVRWSSDPEVPDDAPAHVLVGNDETKRFLELAVDPRFLSADLMKLVQVTLEDDGNALSRQATIDAGVHPDNWSTVRMALVIAGNGSHGPMMDDIEWVGTRDQYREGQHMQEAYDHARRRGIRSPSIFPHTDSGPLLRAAQFILEFRRQMKPSLRASENMTRVLEHNLLNTDLSNINGDRATHFIREIQRAFASRHDQAIMEKLDSGETQVQAADFDEEPTEVTKASSGPRLH